MRGQFAFSRCSHDEISTSTNELVLFELVLFGISEQVLHYCFGQGSYSRFDTSEEKLACLSQILNRTFLCYVNNLHMWL